MKKLTIIMIMVLMAAFFTTTVSAQGITAKGVKGGLNFAKFTGDDAEFGGIDPKTYTGFAIGGFLIYSLNDQLSIQPEVFYSRKGSEYKESTYGETIKLTMKMNYLDIPILGVYRLRDNIRLFAGPSINFYLNGTSRVEVDGESEEGDIEREYTTSPDFGLVFGGSYLFNKIVIDARYSLGLRTVDEEGEGEIKHAVIQLMVGFLF